PRTARRRGGHLGRGRLLPLRKWHDPELIDQDRKLAARPVDRWVRGGTDWRDTPLGGGRSHREEGEGEERGQPAFALSARPAANLRMLPSSGAGRLSFAKGCVQ